MSTCFVNENMKKPSNEGYFCKVVENFYTEKTAWSAQTIMITVKENPRWVRTVLHMFNWLIFQYFLLLISRLTPLTSAAKCNQKLCSPVLILDGLYCSFYFIVLFPQVNSIFQMKRLFDLVSFLQEERVEQLEYLKEVLADTSSQNFF